MTNIDRLHDVVLGNSSGRRQGNTTSSAYEVIAEVQMKQELIICVCRFNRDIPDFRILLKELFLENRIFFKEELTFLIAEQSRIEFVTEGSKEQHLRGLDNYSLIHVK